MKDKEFKELLSSIGQVKKIQTGELKAARVFKLHPIIVKRSRKKLHA